MSFFSKKKTKFLTAPQSPLANFFKKKSKGRFVLLVAFLLVFFVSSQVSAQAPKIPSAVKSITSVAASTVAGVASSLVTPVLQVITFFCALFVDLAATFLGFMLKPDLYNFTREPIINYGWSITRDICNMFFLIILLFIAFCTILQIDKYHAKKTLLTLILMALLINFSKPIAIFIFDGSQLLMNYFLRSMGNYETTVTNLSQIADIVYRDLPGFFTTLWSSISGGPGFTGTAVQYLFAIIFLFMYGVALIILGIYLLIRIVALWLIIIVSPFAFLAMAVPDFKKISSDWWEALFKYSYVGPAIAFFLMISTQLAGSYFRSLAVKYQSGISIVKMGEFIPYVVVITFLYASIIISQKFGIAFAGAITSRADKVLKGGISRLTGARYAGNFLKSHYKHATEAGREKLKQKFPTLHKHLTEEGREKSRQKFWENRFGTKTPARRQQKEIAEIHEKGKKEGYTKDDWWDLLDPLNRAASSSEKMAAALALAKEGKLEDGHQYKAGLDALKSAPKTLQETFEKDAKKKNIHAVIDEEIVRTPAAGHQAVYNKHLDSINPADLGEQKTSILKTQTEFVNWANRKLRPLRAGIKNNMASKLNAGDIADFQINRWI